MVIFESPFTTFEVIEAFDPLAKNGLSLKTNHPIKV